MDKIGSSQIAFVDFIICGVAFALFYALTKLDPNSFACRVLAIVDGCIVLSIIFVLPLSNSLTADGVRELSMIGIFLSIGPWLWNSARIKSSRAPNNSPQV